MKSTLDKKDKRYLTEINIIDGNDEGKDKLSNYISNSYRDKYGAKINPSPDLLVYTNHVDKNEVLYPSNFKMLGSARMTWFEGEATI